MRKIALSCLFLILATSALGQEEVVPCAKHIVVPAYPRIAAVARIQGDVTLIVTIGGDGKVLHAEGSGAHRLLCDSSEKNVRLWVFDAPRQAPHVFKIDYEYKLIEPPYVSSPTDVTFDLPDGVHISTHPVPVESD